MSNAPVKCPICEYTYCEDEPKDVKDHKVRHKNASKGALPYSVREFIKEMARTKANADKESAKKAIAFAYWAKELAHGTANPKQFDEFITKRIEECA